MRRFAAVAVSLLFAASARAAPGSAWLELAPGARASALAEAITASVRGATANYWNPAAVGADGNSVEAMYADSWIEGGSIQYVAGSFDLGRTGLGASAHYVGVGDIDLRDRPSASPIGSYDARNLALGGTFAAEIWRGWRAGIGARYLSERIYVYDTEGWAFDLGVLRRGLFDGRLDLAAAARHLGKIGALRAKAEELPATIAAGARWDFGEIDRTNPALLLEMSKVSGYEANLRLAAEVGVLGYLSFRAGYATGYDSHGFAAGFGLSYKGVRFDFAWIPHIDNLGNETRYSVGADW